MANVLTTKESSAVQAHITMSQGVINRMASNSSNCKTWTITILAAILALYADDKISTQTIWICYIPTGLFFFLDCFYLGLERQFIKKQSALITKINSGIDVSSDLFLMKGESSKTICESICALFLNYYKQIRNTIGALFSFSTLPFYGFIFCFVYYLSKL